MIKFYCSLIGYFILHNYPAKVPGSFHIQSDKLSDPAKKADKSYHIKNETIKSYLQPKVE
ncbi:hypothetical protein EG343_01680 [Chryseobacterium nakagawai]|uniref:Uncharacterized protein n=1 Tax=Chryseobacterium nakagawai TaxID=1241982 RepID=A0AAD0YI46_CHRNA|nr:hypothetical protein EG343_01680 [Chryseobacterium nakagawai]